MLVGTTAPASAPPDLPGRHIEYHRFPRPRIELVYEEVPALSAQGSLMLTFEDCLELCELTEDEVDAIAEHEQLSRTVAVELGQYLIQGPDGQLLIERMIVDDIIAARQRGDLARAAHLKQTLRRFIEAHAEGGDREA
jgi:hypothetical protein